MKVILNILCWLCVVACCSFPFIYNHSSMDKKEIQVSHILVNTEQEAIDIKKQIVAGKDFGEMAEKYSQCPSSKNKGSVGYNTPGTLIPDFEKVAFNLEKNVVSEPVKTKEGWHLIKITDIKYYSDDENFDRRYF